MKQTAIRFLAALATAALVAPALGQYINAHAGKATQTQQNPWLGGQRSDLEFEITKVVWKKDPCESDPTVFILKGAFVHIEIDWVKAYRMGKPVGQAESPSRLADDDFFTILWDRMGGRWTLTSVTENGTNMAAAANPRVTISGNGTWDGGKFTPPPGFEEGKNNPIEYILCFEYNPFPGDQCWVAPLKLKGWYIHTYDGDTHISASPGMTVSPGFPWASVSASISFANDHAWTKQLVQDGKKFVRTYDPAPCVPFEICCPGGGTFTRPSPTGTMSPTNPIVPRNNNPNAGVTGQNFGNVQFTAYTPGGDIVASELVGTPPACNPCNADFNFVIPFNYEGTLLIIEAALLNLEGPPTVLTTEVTIPDPLTTPVLGSAILGSSDRVIEGDLLTILIEDQSPGLTEFDVSAALHISVQRTLDGSGLLIDEEQFPPVAMIAPGVFEAQIPVSMFAPPFPFDGICSFGPADVISVTYNNADDEPGTSQIAALPSERSVNPWAEHQVNSSGVIFEGFAAGTGRIGFYIDDLVLPVTNVFVEPFGGEPAMDVAIRFATEINIGLFGLPNLSANIHPNFALSMDGYDQGNLHQWTDPGIDLVLWCQADVNGDSFLDNGDIAEFIALFLAGNLAVDFNADGFLDNGDISAFIQAFLAGC